MLIIVDDDDAYLTWLESNPEGFVVNVENPPRPATLQLHRARCNHISTPERSNWTTTGYMKVCSNVISELDEWATSKVGSLPTCGHCKPRAIASITHCSPPAVSDIAPITLPFDKYPNGGRQLLGRRSISISRRGYGLALQQLTKQSNCAYCGISLFDSYEHWLLLQVDHVVPITMGKRLGIPNDWLEDYCNLVLACSACNTFANQFDDPSVMETPQSLDKFLDLRDRVFQARKPIIVECQRKERIFFNERRWES